MELSFFSLEELMRILPLRSRWADWKKSVMATREQTLAPVAGKLKEADGSGGHEAEHLVAETFLTAAPPWPTKYSPW